MVKYLTLLYFMVATAALGKESEAGAKTRFSKDKIYRLYLSENEESFVGTGFALKVKDKVILLTARHICDYAFYESKLNKLYYKLPEDTDFKSIPANKTLRHRRDDTCYLGKLNSKTKAFSLAESVKVGDQFWPVGYPGGLPLIATYGTYIADFEIEMPYPMPIKRCVKSNTFELRTNLLGMDECYWKGKASLITAEVLGGSSGSPILDDDNNVVGMVSAEDTEHFHWCMAVPFKNLKQSVKAFTR